MKTKSFTQRSFAVFATTILLLMALPVTVVFAADTGFLVASTSANGSGGSGWDASFDSGRVSDDSYATTSIQSRHVDYYNYNVPTIPVGSTINGIQVDVEGHTSGRDVSIALSWDGGTTFSTAINAGFTIGVSDVHQTVGSASNLSVWGVHSWVPGDFTNTNFRVRVTSQSGTGTFSLDSVQVKIYYIPRVDTTTTVNCGAGTPVATYGSSISCVTTVTRASGINTPSGTVTWTHTDSGDFSSSTCTLSGSGGIATCSVTYTPSSVGDGTHNITATYGSDVNFNGSNGNQDVTVNKATPTLSVTNGPFTYDGSSHTATLNSSVPGVISDIKYDGSSTAPTNAGSYAVTADFIPTDTANYTSLSDASAGNFVINKANPTLSVTNSPVTYNGSPQAATVEGSIPGTVSDVRYDGSTIVPTGAATYAITADFVPTDSTNYNSLNNASAGSFVINKATPTVSVTNSPVTYDGSPHAATVEGSVPGLVSDIKYNGSSTVPTNAGTYAITADFTPTESANYNTLNDASAGNFVIDKATPTISVTNSPVTYTGSPQAAVVEGSVPGVVLNVKYDGSSTVPVDVGTYAVTADFVPIDSTNYNSLTETAAGDFVINKATPTVTVTNSPVVYDGGSQPAAVFGSVPGVVSDIKYNGSSTEPIDAGTYAITADFVPIDTTNYNSLDDASAGNLVVEKATPTISVTNSPVTFNGSPQAASVSSSAAGTISDVRYNASPTEPTNAGTYAVTGDFVPTDLTNYNSLSDTSAGNFVIEAKAVTVTAINQSKFVGDPDPIFTFAAGGFVGSDSFIIDPICAVSGPHDAPGTYDIVCSGGDAGTNYNISYINGTLTVNAVNSAPTDIALSPSSVDENQPVGTVVGALSTTDPDAGDTFTYSLVTDPVNCPAAADNASFSISGSNLQTAAIFDFETKSSYSICVRSTDSGALFFTKPFTVTVNNRIDTATFADVPTSYWSWAYIESIYAAGITGGCGVNPLVYCPTGPVTRAQMAVFLLRGIHGGSYTPPAATGTVFADVPSGYWAAAWIERLAAEGVTAGCGGGNYCPESPVTRAQMAVFLLKSKHGIAFAPPAATGTVFADVSASYWAGAWIEQLASESITGGCGGGNYCPDSAVTRDQMAVFLQRTFSLLMP